MGSVRRNCESDSESETQASQRAESSKASTACATGSGSLPVRPGPGLIRLSLQCAIYQCATYNSTATASRASLNPECLALSA